MKHSIEDTVRDKDIYIISDVSNYGLKDHIVYTYETFDKLLIIKRDTDDINTLLEKYMDYKNNIIVTDI